MPVRPLIDSLLIYDPSRSTATANLWVAHPSPSEEAAFGKLFMVVSIDTADRLNHEIINALQDQLRHAYYQSAESKFTLAFEQALHTTNQHLHRMVIEGVDGWVENLHCLVGVFHNGHLLIANAGSMMAFVLRRGRMHDILGPQSAPINPLKIFSNILEGELNEHDQLLVCTPSVLDYFSLEKLRRTMVEHTPAESVRQLESSLLGSEQFIALAALIIQAEGQTETEAFSAAPIREIGRPSTLAPQRSMETLIAKERATDELLTPSIWPSVRDTMSRAWLGGSRFVTTTIFRRPARRTLPAGSRPVPTAQHSSTQGRSLIATFQRGGGWFLNSLRRSVQNLWLMTQRRRARRELHQSSPTPKLPTTKSSPLNRLVVWFSRLSSPQRRIVGLAVLLLFVFTGTIILTNRNRGGASAQPTVIAAQIDDHLTKAEAALLYGGEETATSELAEAVALLEELPTRTKDDRSRIENINDRVATVRSQLRRLVLVSNPEIVAQTAEVAPTIRPQQLYWTGSLVFSYAPDKQTGVLVDTSTADEPRVITNPIDTGQVTTGTVTTSGMLLFATERQGFVELNLSTERWRPFDVTWPAGDHIVQSLAVFQNRLYALDRAEGEIFRFAIGSASLGTGVRWLKEEATLTAGRAIAVDGSIYILQPSGRIEEYFNGRRSEFAVAQIDPALTNPTRLVTTAAATKLYVVDPSNKRLVVFDKNGKLVRQYQSTSWGSLTDVAVNEASKTALVLNGTTIYRLPLQD